jgi:hypothetical protein
MTKFEDQLFADLMREHRSTLAQTRRPAPPRQHTAARRTLTAAGVGGLGVAAAAGALVATSGGSPAYAVTTHPDGTVSLAVYQASGIAGANAKLHLLGDRVVLVPVRAGCPQPAAPAVSGRGHQITVGTSVSRDGSVTVDAKGIPAGDILVVGVETKGHSSLTGGMLTSPPAPSCISLPSLPVPPGGSGYGSSSVSGNG